MVKIAILDDWQDVARGLADWKPLQARAELTFFHTAFASLDEAAEMLAPFAIVLALRERTPFPAALLERLPELRLIAMTGPRAGSLDLEAATRLGIAVATTESDRSGAATAELALGLLLAAARHIAAGDRNLRAGRFQEGIGLGRGLAGKTLGIIGLGRIGSRLARYAQALEMRTLAWSPNLTPERAEAAGCLYARKEALLADSDAVSLHLVLSERTRHILGRAELSLMKPGAILINTARAALIEEGALIEAVESRRLIAALDVFHREPLPPDHPLRRAPNTVLTPHLGYVTEDIMRLFYTQAVENIEAFLDGRPLRIINPEALGKRLPPAPSSA
jgi:phosphoglycerate dehydrogenase-like enzyme